MKKTYLNPTIEVVEVKTDQLLDKTSIQMNGSAASVNDGGDYNTLGRGGSDWDDED